MYTVKIVKNKLAILTSTTLSKTITIKSDDKRFDKCVEAAKARRLVNITQSGRFTSSKDYHGAYESKSSTRRNWYLQNLATHWAVHRVRGHV